MSPDERDWWLSAPAAIVEVVLVGCDLERLGEVASLLAAAGHRVNVVSSEQPAIGRCTALALLSDLPAGRVGEVVRAFLDQLRPEQQVVSRFRSGTGQIVWCR